MTTMFTLIEVCVWILGYPKLEVLEVLVGSLEFCSPNFCILIVLLSVFV